MNMDLDQLSRTVGAIYDAALDRRLWFPALEHIRDLMGAKTAALASYDQLDSNPAWPDLAVGYTPYWTQLLAERYGRLSPYLWLVAEMGCGEAAYGSALPDYERTVRGSVYYEEWMKPQDLYDASVLIFDKSLTTIGTLVTVKAESAGNFGPDTIEKYHLLFPHVRRSVLIGRTIGELAQEKAGIAAALDGLGAGVVVLGTAGAITYANRAAQGMMTPGGPLGRANGALSLARRAQEALDQALGAMAQGDLAAAAKGVSIPLAGADGAFLLHLLPLGGARTAMIDTGGGARAIAFVRPVRSGHGDAIDTLADRHALTAREREVLRAMIDIGGVPMIAEVLGISQTTARSHVTSIFDKTGIRSQAGLIRALGGA